MGRKTNERMYMKDGIDDVKYKAIYPASKLEMHMTWEVLNLSSFNQASRFGRDAAFFSSRKRTYKWVPPDLPRVE